jgi:hypothetical protein
MEKMQEKIDEIFNRIKVPESGLSLGDSNIIEKLRYIELKNKLVVVKYPMHSPEGCCTLISNAMLNSVLKNLRNELEIAFPSLTIEVI